MKTFVRFPAWGLALLLTLPAFIRGQRPEVLTEDEQDKMRETQDPSERIDIFLSFAQERLERFETYRRKPADPKVDTGAYLDSVLGEYVAVTDELKDWIDYQYERHGDMRKGLHALLKRGPEQLEQLHRIQQTPDAYSSAYADTLRDAIADVSDTLDGAAKALGEQEKKFAASKREEKSEARDLKLREKEERKRTKEEKKLRKKEQKHLPREED